MRMLDKDPSAATCTQFTLSKRGFSRFRPSIMLVSVPLKNNVKESNTFGKDAWG